MMDFIGIQTNDNVWNVYSLNVNTAHQRTSVKNAILISLLTLLEQGVKNHSNIVTLTHMSMRLNGQMGSLILYVLTVHITIIGIQRHRVALNVQPGMKTVQNVTLMKAVSSVMYVQTFLLEVLPEFQSQEVSSV